MSEVKVLIGGRALVALGSSRNTQDTDYLVNRPEDDRMFIADAVNNTDYINAAQSYFYAELWETEKGREIASPQALLEMKAWAFVQHCQNFFWQKADDAEYDIKFLCRKFNLDGVKIVGKYIAPSALKEINKVISSVKK